MEPIEMLPLESEVEYDQILPWIAEISLAMKENCLVLIQAIDIFMRSVYLLHKYDKAGEIAISSIMLSNCIYSFNDTRVEEYLKIVEEIYQETEIRKVIANILKITGCKLIHKFAVDERKYSLEVFNENSKLLPIVVLYTIPLFARLPIDKKTKIQDLLEGKESSPQDMELYRRIMGSINPTNYNGKMKRILAKVVEGYSSVKLGRHSDEMLKFKDKTLQSYNPGTIVKRLYSIRNIGKGSYGSVDLMDDLSYERLYDEETKKYLEKPCAMKTIASQDIGDILPEIICMIYCNSALTLIDYDIIVIEDEFVANIIFPELEELKNPRGKIVEIISAMRDFHKCGFFHGDVKSTNMMIDPSTGNVVLIDYGFSRKLNRTITDLIGYSVGYQAPESVESPERVISQKTDIWALGMTLAFICNVGVPKELGDLAVKLRPLNKSEMGRMVELVSYMIDKVKDPLMKKIISKCLTVDESSRPTAYQLLEMM